jgi:hypothetical protein
MSLKKKILYFVLKRLINTAFHMKEFVLSSEKAISSTILIYFIGLAGIMYISQNFFASTMV